MFVFIICVASYIYNILEIVLLSRKYSEICAFFLKKIFFCFVLTRQEVKVPDCLVQYQTPGKSIITL